MSNKHNPQSIVLIAPTATVEHILAQPFYTTESLSTEGFIHACTLHQVEYVVGRFYNQESELSILELDPELITATIKYATATNDKQDLGGFPHIFGAINTNAIINVVPISLKPNHP